MTGKILSVGAAGKFAGLVVPELVKRGAQVRGLTHTPDHVGKVRQNGAQEAVVADLRDPASLDKALEGVERVFYVAPAFQTDEPDLGRNMVAAAKRAGVRRIVFSSVIDPILTELGNHGVKGPVEQAMIASDLEYTFLHPTLFFQNYALAWPKVAETGVFAEPYSSEKPITRVDYRDVAEVAAIALTEDRLLFGTFQLCAEGNLNRHQVAKLMGEAIGRTVEAKQISFDEFVGQAKMDHDSAQLPALKKMYDWYDAHGLLGSAVTLRAVLGREPRTLLAYFKELAIGTKTQD